MFLLIGRYARGVAAALAAVGLAAVAGAQANRPLAIGDLITAVRVADPQLSPDGRTVAFVRTTTDTNADRRTRESLEKDPVQVRALRRLMFRHWNEWRVNVRHHIFVADLNGGDVLYVSPGDVESPPHFYEDNSVTFSPDGRELVYVSKGD